MKIESIIKRASGTEVVLDRTRYVFLPIDKNDPQSPHVCDVSDEDHVATFLRIKEGYREYEEGAAPAPLRIVAPEQVQPKGRDLPPIQAALEDEDEEREAAIAEQQEFMRQLAASHAENAAAVSRANTDAFAAALRDGADAPDDTEGFKPGAALADTFTPDPEDDGEGALSAANLANEPIEKLRATYEAFVGHPPAAKINRNGLIKAITETKK